MPRLSTRENRPSSKEAPSSIEYSVWTCRCTKESEPVDMERGSHLPEGSREEPEYAFVGKDVSVRRRQSATPRRHSGAGLRTPGQRPAICRSRAIRSAVG